MHCRVTPGNEHSIAALFGDLGVARLLRDLWPVQVLLALRERSELFLQTQVLFARVG